MVLLPADNHQTVYECIRCHAVIKFFVPPPICFVDQGGCGKRIPGYAKGDAGETFFREIELDEYGNSATEREAPQAEIFYADRHLHEVSNIAMLYLSLFYSDEPELFVRGGQLVRIVRDEFSSPTIAALNESGLRGEIDRCTTWKKWVRQDKEWVAVIVHPPMDIVKDILNRPQTEWALPLLTGIASIPIIHQDGSIRTEAGYDPRTATYYAPSNGFVLPEIPDEPTKDDAKKCLEELKDIICDFPFVAEADRANMIGAMMTPILRSLIAGSVPLALIDKPQAGTGASLLAEIVISVATGTLSQMTPPPNGDDETRKVITSVLCKGRPVAVIDNLEGRLYAPSLCAMLTAPMWEDRILGRSEMITLPCRTVWIATGNNIQLAGDLPRRCYRIRIDAKTAQPWLRNGPEPGKLFKHDPLIPWVIENRPHIIALILTMARAWIRAGSPVHLKPLGSYEDWSKTVGGILEYCDYLHFLGNLQELYSESDIETPQWSAFLGKWNSIWPDNPVPVSRIISYLEMEERQQEELKIDTDSAAMFMDILPDAISNAWTSKRKSFSRILGNALAKKSDVHFPDGDGGEYIIARKGTRDRAILWKVEHLNGKADALPVNVPGMTNIDMFGSGV